MVVVVVVMFNVNAGGQMLLILQPTSKDLIMKVLEQARPNLPQKHAKSAKEAEKGHSKREMLTADDDTDTAALSKPSSAAAGKTASKQAGKPSSAAASAAVKKVSLFSVKCHTLILKSLSLLFLVAVIFDHVFTLGFVVCLCICC